MKKLAIVAFLVLFITSAHAEEIGYSNKIESAVASCANCNVCPDGKTIESGKVCLYLFWGSGCPHCAEEKPFLEELKAKYPNLVVYEFEIYGSQENVNLWSEVCKKYGVQPVGVPMTFVGDKAFIGFVKNSTSTGSTYTGVSPNSTFFIAIIAVVSVVVVVLILLLTKKVRIKVKV